MCRQCELKPVYEFTNKRKLCGNCFVRYFQKKVFYTLRKFRMTSQGKSIAYKNNYDFRDAVLEDILKMLSRKSMNEIVNIPSIENSNNYSTNSQEFSKGQFRETGKSINKIIHKRKTDKIALSSTIDSEAGQMISILISQDAKSLEELAPVWKNIIRPLYLFLDEEVLLYAKLRKLKFKEKKIKKDKISGFISELEKSHPEVKHAIVNSYLKMYL